MITVRKAKEEDRLGWDEYVLLHKDASPYHLYAWRLAIESAYKHRSHYFLAEDGTKIVGVLPVVRIAIPFIKQEFCSLPFCDLGGALADNEDVAEQLLKYAMNEFGGQLNIRASQSVYRQQEEFKQGEKVRMLLALPSGAEELFASFKSKLRSQVRKAEKNGVSFRHGDVAKDMPGFYSVMQNNMHQLGSPVHSFKWFSEVLKHFNNKAQLFVVEYDGVIVGASILLLTNNVATVPWASTLPEYNKYAPNMLLYWAMLKYAAENGFEFFDFGRSSYGEGTFKFKKQWGAQAVSLDWREYDQGKLVAHATENQGKIRSLIATAWTKLPFAAVNFLGPQLRRYISL